MNTKRIINEGQGERAQVASHTGAGLAYAEALEERSAAPWFTFGLNCVSPKEARRDEFVHLRDRMDGLLRTAERSAGDDPIGRVLAYHRMRASVEYADLMARMARIPKELAWVENPGNLVVTVGGNDLLTNQFKGSSYTAAWYLGLIDNASFSAVALADTMASHAGWLESTVYSNGTRISLSFGTASAKSLAASAAAFSINGTATINGAFSATNSTKGGTTGTLYSAGSFSATRSVVNGDTLNVTLTVTA